MKAPTLFLNAEDYFKNVVDEALQQRKMKTFPLAEFYLVRLLNQFVTSENLENKSLAEMFLQAQTTQETPKKVELLKKLGDISLYISGMFADSLDRKIVDVEYYTEMGGTAYGNLAEAVQKNDVKMVYKEYSSRFVEFVDVLNVISQKVFTHDNESILRLYSRYLKTGSELARETLLEKGVLSVPFDKNKKNFEQ